MFFFLLDFIACLYLATEGKSRRTVNRCCFICYFRRPSASSRTVCHDYYSSSSSSPSSSRTLSYSPTARAVSFVDLRRRVGAAARVLRYGARAGLWRRALMSAFALRSSAETSRTSRPHRHSCCPRGRDASCAEAQDRYAPAKRLSCEITSRVVCCVLCAICYRSLAPPLVHLWKLFFFFRFDVSANHS